MSLRVGNRTASRRGTTASDLERYIIRDVRESELDRLVERVKRNPRYVRHRALRQLDALFTLFVYLSRA